MSGEPGIRLVHHLPICWKFYVERCQNWYSPSLLSSIAVRSCGPGFWRKSEKVIENKYRIIGSCYVSKSKRANLAILLITEMRGECRSALPGIKRFPVFLEVGDNQRK